MGALPGSAPHVSFTAQDFYNVVQTHPDEPPARQAEVQAAPGMPCTAPGGGANHGGEILGDSDEGGHDDGDTNSG